ncbi:MAG: TolC family protein, partial [Gammaproteobacteria bacterium]
MLKKTTANWRRILWLACVFNTACSVAPQNFQMPVDIPASFSDSGQTDLQARWWLSFNDPELNRLIDIALKQNLTLRATFNRLEQAKAVARKTGSELIPALSGNTGISSIRPDTPGQQRATGDSFSMGLAASYELDLWGRIRAGTQAAELEVEASAFDVQTAAIA